MVDAIERVRKLIVLATTEGTPEQEARTAALLAVRIIAREKLNVSRDGMNGPRDMRKMFEDLVNGTPVRPPPPGYDYHAVPKRKIRAKYPGRCGTCGDSFEEGAVIFWSVLGGVDCGTCGKKR
jgi:hypothetical protein